jgi:hypothetical protein
MKKVSKNLMGKKRYLLGLKAQGATEYLIILAVVIIIGLIVIGVLRNVPSQGTAAKARTNTGFWESAEIGISSIAIDSTGLTMFVKNNNAFPVKITNIKFDTTNAYTTDTTFNPGETKKLTSTTITCTAGNAFAYDVTIEYTDLKTGGDYTYKGLGNQLEGVCAG